MINVIQQRHGLTVLGRGQGVLQAGEVPRICVRLDFRGHFQAAGVAGPNLCIAGRIRVGARRLTDGADALLVLVRGADEAALRAGAVLHRVLVGHDPDGIIRAVAVVHPCCNFIIGDNAAISVRVGILLRRVGVIQQRGVTLGGQLILPASIPIHTAGNTVLIGAAIELDCAFGQIQIQRAGEAAALDGQRVVFGHTNSRLPHIESVHAADDGHVFQRQRGTGRILCV